ncbi:hypothetical protein PCG10_003674 [Penicillium crustosum]|uniref:Uncharacterized protein n=1 Tax=Penicillium crustosum TaxID=36656 RepID=A0A9P5GZL3_PENCR|nr:uncharacterized protein N7487_008231 [Penicillium crustosum]KAF7530303.1 hypothetical protein PCG10_003674 [Penicillium crustosum]KAJ5402335.1 hypothetical protein N7487_008231 [Penicillium crustosum]
MTITWNEKADAKLLAGILATSSTPIDFNALAEYMGDGVTVSALRHRVARLRAKGEEDDNASPSLSPVVKKRQRRTPKKSAQTTATAESGGEGGATKDEENQAEDAKAKKPKIKHEETEDYFPSSESIKEEEDSDI